MKKKGFIILAVLVVLAIIIGIVIVVGMNESSEVSNTGKSNTNSSNTIKTSQGKVNIKPIESSKVTLTEFSNDDFSMKIPEGWKVECDGEGIYYAVRVYDPNNSNNGMLCILKAYPFYHTQAASDYFKMQYQYQPNTPGLKVLADAPVFASGTSEYFFSQFETVTTFLNKQIEYATMKFPTYNNFKVLESANNNSTLTAYAIDDKTLRATFTGENGKKGEGMFSATMVDFNTATPIIDTSFYMVYNVMAITADENDFVNWEEVLTKSLSTLEFSDALVQEAKAQGEKDVATSKALSAQANETLNGIMSSWENRNKSLDISSQKYSDATLGYERVYDTDTGEIYKAYNGFTDDYTGSKYQAITDDMYSEQVTGYITK